MIDFIALLSVFCIVFVAYFKHSLQKNAILPSIIIGFILYLCGGISILIALYVFFISSSIVSKIRKSEKEKIGRKFHDKSSNRDISQVLASGIVVVICVLLYALTLNQVFYVMSFVSLAIANADTWASEIGVLSKRDPWTIIPCQVCPKGMSGGISVLGFGASILGASLIGCLYLLFHFSFSTFWLIVIFGVLGSLVDSVLGSTCQVLYYYPKGKKYSEVKLNGYIKIKGFSFMSNEMVNVLSNVITCLFLFLVRI